MKRIFILFILCSIAAGATQRIVYVDTDESTGTQDGTTWATAYDCLNDAFQGEEGDISVTSGSDEYVTFYCRASSGTADVNQALIDDADWTLEGPDNYVEVIGFDFPSDGIYDANFYVLEALGVSSNYSHAATQEGFTRWRNLQFNMSSSSWVTTYCINLNSSKNNAKHYVDSCIFKMDRQTGGGPMRGLGCLENGTTTSEFFVYNCTFHGGYDCLFIAGQVNYAWVYNCTIYGGDQDLATVKGVNCAATGDTEFINVISANTNDDFSVSTGTIDYCASDDGDGTNAVGPVGGDWANELNDTVNEDFTLVADGNCISGGTDDPNSGLFLDDITGATRVSTWDIGAFDDAPSTPGGQQVIINVAKLMGKTRDYPAKPAKHRRPIGALLGRKRPSDPVVSYKNGILNIEMPEGKQYDQIRNYILTCGDYDTSGIKWAVK